MDIDDMEEGQLVYVKKMSGIDWRHGGGMEEGTIGKIDNIANPFTLRVKSPNFGYPDPIAFAFHPDEVHPIEPGLEIWDEKHEEKGVIKRIVSSDEYCPYRIHWPESKVVEYSKGSEKYLMQKCHVIVDEEPELDDIEPAEEELAGIKGLIAAMDEAKVGMDKHFPHLFRVPPRILCPDGWSDKEETEPEEDGVLTEEDWNKFINSLLIHPAGWGNKKETKPEEIKDNSFRRLIRRIKRDIKKLKGEKPMQIEGTFKIEEVDDGFICTVEAEGVEKTCANNGNGDQGYLLQYTFGKVKREINTKEETEEKMKELQEQWKELRDKKGE